MVAGNARGSESIVQATSAAGGNRAQLSKFTWRNQEPALAEPGDVAGLAGAGGGVCGGVITLGSIYPTPWAAGVVGGAAGSDAGGEIPPAYPTGISQLIQLIQ